MKIKILDSIAGHGNPKLGIPEFSYSPGQIVTVKHSLALALIKRGAAIAVESEPVPAESEPVTKFSYNIDAQSGDPEVIEQTVRRAMTGSKRK